LGHTPQSAGNGHWWQRRPPGIIPGPRAPQRLAEGGGLCDWRKVVPALKQSRAEELRRKSPAASRRLTNTSKAGFASRISVVTFSSDVSKVIHRFARLARCDLSCVRPERTNGVTPYRGHDHVRGFPGRKSWAEDTVPPGWENRN
jgi:hypothetical protein